MWLVKLLVASNVVTWVIGTFGITALSRYLAFDSNSVQSHPWTVLTYPLVAAAGVQYIIAVAAGCYWLWTAGGALERSWGSRSFGLYFLGMSLISVLALAAGGFIAGKQLTAAGLWLPLAGLTVAFAVEYAQSEVRFLFVFPMKAKHLIPITVAICFIAYMKISIVVALCSLAGCAFSGVYARSDRRGYGAPKNTMRLYPKRNLLRVLNPWRWYAELRDRRRLKKLFNKSDYRR
jgi:membrane associated rhomboid family serine protease